MDAAVRQKLVILGIKLLNYLIIKWLKVVNILVRLAI